MIARKSNELVLAIYPQTSGFAFVLFKGWNAPLDFGAYEVRGGDKNARCLKRVESLFALHMPDMLVLQQMLRSDTRRAPRIQKLNRDIGELIQSYDIAVRTYPRAELREAFAYHFDTTTKQKIAQTIANQIPALGLYLPPERKPWKGEHLRMGIFEGCSFGVDVFSSQQ